MPAHASAQSAYQATGQPAHSSSTEAPSLAREDTCNGQRQMKQRLSAYFPFAQTSGRGVPGEANRLRSAFLSVGGTVGIGGILLVEFIFPLV